MGTRSCGYILLLCLTSTLAGCDSQASPDYVGKALITLRGSVEIEQAPEGELEPALAFFNGETGTVHIVDVVVEGEFPSDFTLRVIEPPPDEAFFEGPAGIRSALGYITAVTADHADSFRYATQREASAECYEAGDPAQQICDHQRWWCTTPGEDQACYGEWERCTDAGDNDDESACELVQTVGDPALKDIWSNFAGLSEDLVLVYLDEALEADTEDAIRLGLPGLDAGYALLEPQPEHDPDSEDGDECDRSIERRAAELHEEKYHTGLSYEDLIAQGGCGGENQDEWIPCDPRRHMIWDQIHQEFGPQAAAEIGCRETGTWRVVEEPEREHIEIRIGKGVQPSLFAPDRVGQTQEFAPSLSFDPTESGDYQRFDPCGEPEVEEIGWNEASPLGETPEALFAALEEGCTSTLVWDSSGSERRITPASGSTEITVELQFDRASARYVGFPAELRDRCDERLEIEGELTVRTADGAIDDHSTVTLRPGGAFFVDREIDMHGGTLDVEREDGEIFFVAYALSGAGADCAGAVSLLRQTEISVRGERSVESFRAGEWSNNGCDLGGKRIQIMDAIEGLGDSPVEIVERMFGDVAIDGRWQDDGTDARLQLSAAVAGDDTACAYRDFIDLPVAITYSTSDGTIAEHVGEGLANLSWRNVAAPTGRLFMHDAQDCDSPDASLAYTPADCNDVLRVHTSMNLRHDGSAVEPFEDLQVYAFDRGGLVDRLDVDFDVESADDRRTFELER